MHHWENCTGIRVTALKGTNKTGLHVLGLLWKTVSNLIKTSKTVGKGGKKKGIWRYGNRAIWG